MAERTRATHMADKLRAELEWRGRVQGQEERRLRSHAQHVEEGRRRVEAQLACVAMEVERRQILTLIATGIKKGESRGVKLSC